MINSFLWKSLPFVCLLLIGPSAHGQFAPGAGQSGTTAIPADSSIIINWAIACTVERGPLDIVMPELGDVTAGAESDGTGIADGTIVSLGDGGTATLIFEYPIANGPGWDFAVFENGFPTFGGYFLELATVAVSSDGQNFVPFPATSLTPTDTQLPGFGALQPIQLDGLAGKYEVGFGTPFDLDMLSGAPMLNLQQITHVRLTDVVGSIDPAYATYDDGGRPINDPWPTPFPSGGFDLDGVGVMHQNIDTATETSLPTPTIKLWPNPVRPGMAIYLEGMPGKGELRIYNAVGQLLRSIHVDASFAEISTMDWVPGAYMIHLELEDGRSIEKRVIVVF